MKRTEDHLLTRRRLDIALEENIDVAPFEPGGMLGALKGIDAASYIQPDGWNRFSGIWCREAVALDNIDLVELRADPECTGGLYPGSFLIRLASA